MTLNNNVTGAMETQSHSKNGRNLKKLILFFIVICASVGAWGQKYELKTSGPTISMIIDLDNSTIKYGSLSEVLYYCTYSIEKKDIIKFEGTDLIRLFVKYTGYVGSNVFEEYQNYKMITVHSDGKVGFLTYPPSGDSFYTSNDENKVQYEKLLNKIQNRTSSTTPPSTPQTQTAPSTPQTQTTLPASDITNILKISKIEFVNTDYDGNLLGDWCWNCTKYASDIKYLNARIVCTNNSSSSLSKKLYIKIIKPDYQVIEGSSSPTGYTKTVDITIGAGEKDKVIYLGGYGTDNGGYYKAGSYDYEIWCDGKRLITYSFSLSSKSTEPSATIEKVWLEHNVVNKYDRGMNIHVHFTVNNMKGIEGYCNATFYLPNGESLHFTAVERFTPSYDNAEYKDFVLFTIDSGLYTGIDYYGLTNMKVQITLYNGRTILGKSDFIPFTYNKSNRTSY